MIVGKGNPFLDFGMNLFEKIANNLAKILYWIAGAAIVVMMLLTCMDVVLRYLRRPIPGTYELVCFLSAVAVAFAMAHTSVERGHVAVSLVVRLLPERVQGIVESITALLGVILFGLISWQSVLYANDFCVNREVSLTLQLPFYPFVYGIGFAAAAVCVVLLVDLSKNLTKVFGK
ncbi:MAG: TRAP transporter small permease [Deltaproteobacteria bacterium]|nr:TRAP transporter small permease [Deltaproteobacteria bacterium]